MDEFLYRPADGVSYKEIRVRNGLTIAGNMSRPRETRPLRLQNGIVQGNFREQTFMFGGPRRR